MKRDVRPDGEIVLSGDGAEEGGIAFRLRRLRRPDAVLVTVTGYDRGQLGAAALDEIAALSRLPSMELFVDARGATGVTTAVREEWTRWFQAHQSQLSRVHILVSDRFMRSVVDVAQHLGRVGALFQVHADAATFEAESAP